MDAGPVSSFFCLLSFSFNRARPRAREDVDSSVGGAWRTKTIGVKPDGPLDPIPTPRRGHQATSEIGVRRDPERFRTRQNQRVPTTQAGHEGSESEMGWIAQAKAK